MAAAGVYLVNKDVNQGRVAMMLPGIMRDNPDYFSLIVMNDILGGGGFTSRIVNRVRSDEGLAYSAYSGFPGGVYFPYAFTAGFQSKSRTVAYAASIVIEEMKRIAAEPVSAEELENSKKGFIDRLPRSFASKAQVAGVLAGDEFTGRYATDPDYLAKGRCSQLVPLPARTCNGWPKNILIPNGSSCWWWVRRTISSKATQRIR